MKYCYTLSNFIRMLSERRARFAFIKYLMTRNTNPDALINSKCILFKCDLMYNLIWISIVRNSAVRHPAQWASS